MKIMIAYDGSVDADGALHDLEFAGLPAKAKVLVVTITAPWVDFSPEGQAPLGYSFLMADFRRGSLQDARQLSERAAAALCNRFPHWMVKADTGIHEPAFGLLEKAEKWKPNLIVLGSHGHTALARLLMGSVSQNVLHHAKTDVRITRPRIRARATPLRILVGVDGSRGSMAAVDAVAAREWPAKTEFRVVGALGDRLGPARLLYNGGGKGYEVEMIKLRRSHTERKVEQAVQRLALAGLEAEPLVVSGDARSVLVKEAKSWGADCIFLGCRGLGALDRFLMGSVSSSVASHAPCSVEIIRKSRISRRQPL